MITLEKLLGGFDFARKMFQQIIAPPAVLAELCQNLYLTPADYLQAFQINDFIAIQSVTAPLSLPYPNRLHEGEKQAISLAYELNLPLLIEETLGRKVALTFGLKISGIAGQILKAHKMQVISRQEAIQMLDHLLILKRINQNIFDSIIKAFPVTSL